MACKGRPGSKKGELEIVCPTTVHKRKEGHVWITLQFLKQGPVFESLCHGYTVLYPVCVLVIYFDFFFLTWNAWRVGLAKVMLGGRIVLHVIHSVPKVAQIYEMAGCALHTAEAFISLHLYSLALKTSCSCFSSRSLAYNPEPIFWVISPTEINRAHLFSI